MLNKINTPIAINPPLPPCNASILDKTCPIGNKNKINTNPNIKYLFKFLFIYSTLKNGDNTLPSYFLYLIFAKSSILLLALIE